MLPAQPENRTVTLRQPALVVLCGISASGKSTYARKNFASTQIVSSDECRAILSDDAANMAVSGRAFELFHSIIGQRLEFGRTTVADSTALTKKARSILAKLADEHKAYKVLVAFNANVEDSISRDALRASPVGEAVIRRQAQRFRQVLSEVAVEGWDQIVIMNGNEQDDPHLRFGSFDLRDQSGPFDIIGDVHGCTSELRALIEKLGYKEDAQGIPTHPAKRELVFIGDLADRGPDSAGALGLVMRWAEMGRVLYTPGNHCNKLLRYLEGRRVVATHGFDSTIAQVEAREQKEPGFKSRLKDFIAEASMYLWLDGGALVVAHGGIKEKMIGRDDRTVQTMCLYGDITGKNNADGSPVRLDWAEEYRGAAAVVYGHTPTPSARWRNNTINIDQGCVFGGHLTALRWPEREIVQVAAEETYVPGKDMSDLT